MGAQDELYLTYTGQEVKAGTRSIRSTARRSSRPSGSTCRRDSGVNELPKDAGAEARADASAVYNASMQKLVLWGVSREQLDKLDKEFDATGKVPTHFTVTSPITGTVVRKEITQGQYLQVGDAYAVADLSSLWLKAKVYEADIPLVKVGQRVEVQVESLPNRTIRATVTYLSFRWIRRRGRSTRGWRCRTKGLVLRPGMFATAIIKVPAVADDGTDTCAATTQATAMGNAEAKRRGLQKAIAALPAVFGAAGARQGGGGAGVVDETVEALEPLSRDSKLKDAYARLAAAVKETAGEDIEALRETFKKVSLAMIDIAKVTGQPIDAPSVQVYLCPMKDKPYWLQVTGPTANPYMGLRMFDCGGPVEPLREAEAGGTRGWRDVGEGIVTGWRSRGRR